MPIKEQSPLARWAVRRCLFLDRVTDMSSFNGSPDRFVPLKRSHDRTLLRITRRPRHFVEVYRRNDLEAHLPRVEVRLSDQPRCRAFARFAGKRIFRRRCLISLRKRMSGNLAPCLRVYGGSGSL